jgi:pilus assembly protein Flp/PilA
MQNYLDRAMEFLNSEEGASATEYALLVTLIAVVIVAGFTALGTSLGDYYNRIVTGLPF